MQNIYYVILFALKALIVTWLRPRDTGADIVTNWAVLDSLKNIWCPSLNRSRFLKSIRWTWSKENSLNIFLGGAFNIWVNLISGVANLLHFHSPWFDFVSSYSEKVLQGNKPRCQIFGPITNLRVAPDLCHIFTEELLQDDSWEKYWYNAEK